MAKRVSAMVFDQWVRMMKLYVVLTGSFIYGDFIGIEKDPHILGFSFR